MQYKIYTAGKMAGLDYAAQMGWRLDIEECVKSASTKDQSVRFIHPPMYFKYGQDDAREDEVIAWEINQVCQSDVVVVNLDQIESTIGTHMELGAVLGANLAGRKPIFIVGVGKPTAPLHPWIKEACVRMFEDYWDAADYICRYLLV